MDNSKIVLIATVIRHVTVSIIHHGDFNFFDVLVNTSTTEGDLDPFAFYLKLWVLLDSDIRSFHHPFQFLLLSFRFLHVVGGDL